MCQGPPCEHLYLPHILHPNAEVKVVKGPLSETLMTEHYMKDYVNS